MRRASHTACHESGRLSLFNMPLQLAMRSIKSKLGTQPERLKKIATLCLVLGGIALMVGAVVVRWVDVAIAVSLVCFVAAIILVFWAQISNKG